MIHPRVKHGRSLALMAFVQFLWASSLPADSLHWRTNENRVDADVSSWKVIDVLERVSRATGWKIFVDPEAARRPVNARFRDRLPDKALDSLLGDLNRALLPPTNGSAPRLLVFRTFEAQATQAVRDGSTNPPPAHLSRELIVQLKPGANIDEIARKFGARVIGRNEELNAYRLEFESEEAANAAREALRQHEDVASVDLNYPVYRDPNLETSLAGSSYNLNPQADPNCDQIIVGLIDTALHASGANNSFVLPQISVAGKAGPPAAGPSHGDAMSQTALKGTSYVLKPDEGARVRILPVNVYGDRVTTSTFDVANGINTAINKGAMIINMSLGAPGGTKILQDVIQKGHRQGVVFFGAAGNEPVTTPTYPAAYPEVIAVTAGDAQGNIAPYANRGSFVDVMLPGSSTIVYDNQYWRVSGTSAATALAAGMAAGLAQQNLPCSGSAAVLDHWRKVEQTIRAKLAPKAPAREN